jgi:phosphohistidine phosphatase
MDRFRASCPLLQGGPPQVPLTLILTRHAKSDWDDPALSDHDRPLNPRGRGDAPKIGTWLTRQGHRPEQALVSTARRTQETWERLTPELDGARPELSALPRLYHAEAADILDQLRGATRPTVILIGHNPGIGEFAHRIVDTPAPHPRFIDYPTCATLVATFDAERWDAVDWWSGQVVDFIVPRDL